MTNKPMLSVERELLERAVFKMPFCDARYDLQSIIDTPVIGRKPVAWLVEDIYGQKRHCELERRELRGIENQALRLYLYLIMLRHTM